MRMQAMEIGSDSVLEIQESILDEYRRLGACRNFTLTYDHRKIDVRLPIEEIVVGGRVREVCYRPGLEDPVHPGTHEVLNGVSRSLYAAVCAEYGGTLPPEMCPYYDRVMGDNPVWHEFSEHCGYFQSLTFVYSGRTVGLRFLPISELGVWESDCLDLVGAAAANSKPASAVRERGRWMVFQLARIFEEHFQANPEAPLTLLSIASGSAEVELQALVEMQRRHPSFSANVLLVDPDRKAHEFAHGYANRLRLGANSLISIQSIRAMIGTKNGQDRIRSALESHFRTSTADVATMIGLLDYFKPQQIQRIAGQVRKLLTQGAPLLTALVRPLAEEQMFELYQLYGWAEMQHLGTRSFVDCLLEAGYAQESMQIEVTSPVTDSAISLARVVAT